MKLTEKLLKEMVQKELKESTFTIGGGHQTSGGSKYTDDGTDDSPQSGRAGYGLEDKAKKARMAKQAADRKKKLELEDAMEMIRKARAEQEARVAANIRRTKQIRAEQGFERVLKQYGLDDAGPSRMKNREGFIKNAILDFLQGPANDLGLSESAMSEQKKGYSLLSTRFIKAVRDQPEGENMSPEDAIKLGLKAHEGSYARVMSVYNQVSRIYSNVSIGTFEADEYTSELKKAAADLLKHTNMRPYVSYGADRGQDLTNRMTSRDLNKLIKAVIRDRKVKEDNKGRFPDGGMVPVSAQERRLQARENFLKAYSSFIKRMLKEADAMARQAAAPFREGKIEGPIQLALRQSEFETGETQPEKKGFVDKAKGFLGFKESIDLSSEELGQIVEQELNAVIREKK